MDVPAGPFRTRPAQFVVVWLLALFAFSFIVPSFQPALAQAGDEAAKPDNVGGAQTESGVFDILMHVSRSVGPFWLALLPVSVTLIALVVLLAMDLRMSNCVPPDFVEEFTETVNKRRFKEAFELARNENSFLGRVLTAGMGRLQYGIEDARETAYNAVESARAGKENLLAYVATIGTLGPMIGLVGTVYGMIKTFMVLALGGQKDAAALAKGISEALSITLVGIGLAVPAIFCHAFFRNRLVKIANEAASIADDLLTQMFHFSRKSAPPEPRTAAAPSANAEVRAGTVGAKPAQ